MAFFLVKMFSYKESAGRFTFVFTLNVFNLFRLMTRWHGLFRIGKKNRPIGENKMVWCWSKSQLTFARLSLPINTVFVRPVKFIVFNFYLSSFAGSVIVWYITNTKMYLWNGIRSRKPKGQISIVKMGEKGWKLYQYRITRPLSPHKKTR